MSLLAASTHAAAEKLAEVSVTNCPDFGLQPDQIETDNTTIDTRPTLKRKR